MTERRGIVWAGMLVLVLTIAVFSTGLNGQMMFDDYRSIVANSDIGHFPDVIMGSTRPFTEFTFYVQYALHGGWVVPYHIVNILIHAFAALFLFGIIRRTLSLPRYLGRYDGGASVWIAAMAASFWAVHPLQTESVTYIVQRSESMMGMFALLTLYAFVRRATEPESGKWFAVALASAVLGMLSKPTMVVVPLLVLLYDALFLRGGKGDVQAGSGAADCDCRASVHIALFATCLIPVALLVLPNESSSSAGFHAGRPGAWSYLLTQFDVIGHYLKLCVWPDPLCIDYAWKPVGGIGEVWCSGAALGLFAVLAVVLMLRRNGLGYLASWFLLALVPTSSIIPIDDMAAERRMYLALAAPALLAALGLWFGCGWIGRRLRLSLTKVGILFLLSGCVALVALSLVTINRNAVYESEESMWRNVLESRPDNLRAHMGLGAIALDHNDFGVAEAQFMAVLSRLPSGIEADESPISTLYSLTKTNLGVLRERQQRYKDAEGCFREAIRVSKRNCDARVNLGIVLSREGEAAESERWWREVVEIEPNHAKAHFCLGILELRRGDRAEGRRHLAYAAAGVGEIAESAKALMQE